MFLYSKSDFYLPFKYLEMTIESRRRAGEREVRAKRFVKSMHVGHLRAHPADYAKAVHDFLWEFHFSKLK
jgi:hypothetical protein